MPAIGSVIRLRVQPGERHSKLGSVGTLVDPPPSELFVAASQFPCSSCSSESSEITFGYEASSRSFVPIIVTFGAKLPAGTPFNSLIGLWRSVGFWDCFLSPPPESDSSYGTSFV